MSHRRRAEARLARHIPALQGGGERLPQARIARRADPQSQRHGDPRTIPGDGLNTREGDVSLRTAAQMPRTEPNAPMLIRLIKTPYTQELARPKRVVYRDPPPDPIGVEARQRAGEWRDAVAPNPSPLRGLAHRPGNRPRPFARARSAAAATDEGVV